jgi:hypothetical protein
MLKAILSELKKATAHVLDGPSKEAMLQRAANIESLLGSLLRAVSEKDGLEAVAIVRDIASEIDDATSLSDILADNINDDQFRIDRLKRHAGELQSSYNLSIGMTRQLLTALAPNRRKGWTRRSHFCGFEGIVPRRFGSPSSCHGARPRCYRWFDLCLTLDYTPGAP